MAVVYAGDTSRAQYAKPMVTSVSTIITSKMRYTLQSKNFEAIQSSVSTRSLLLPFGRLRVTYRCSVIACQASHILNKYNPWTFPQSTVYSNSHTFNASGLRLQPLANHQQTTLQASLKFKRMPNSLKLEQSISEQFRKVSLVRAQLLWWIWESSKVDGNLRSWNKRALAVTHEII
jgi:hypothetical protein